MKVVLAGAYGHLGADLLDVLLQAGHEVIALGRAKQKKEDGKQYKYCRIDITEPSTLKGVCDGADVVITTIGLTGASATITNEQVDYQGNLNLLEEAEQAGVRQFVYVSVLTAGETEKVPLLWEKYRFEEELKKSGMSYMIVRPSGYFYDIVKVFRPMIEKGTVTLLGRKQVHANVIATEDLAEFILKHMLDENKTYNIGGKEIYSYEEIAELCFRAAGKETVIKRVPKGLFGVLATVSHLKKNGKESVIRFSEWTLTNEMVADIQYGEHSFREYIRENFEMMSAESTERKGERV